jgi:hypothetical protein
VVFTYAGRPVIGAQLVRQALAPTAKPLLRLRLPTRLHRQLPKPQGILDDDFSFQEMNRPVRTRPPAIQLLQSIRRRVAT